MRHKDIYLFIVVLLIVAIILTYGWYTYSVIRKYSELEAKLRVINNKLSISIKEDFRKVELYLSELAEDIRAAKKITLNLKEKFKAIENSINLKYFKNFQIILCKNAKHNSTLLYLYQDDGNNILQFIKPINQDVSLCAHFNYLEFKRSIEFFTEGTGIEVDLYINHEQAISDRRFSITQNLYEDAGYIIKYDTQFINNSVSHLRLAIILSSSTLYIGALFLYLTCRCLLKKYFFRYLLKSNKEMKKELSKSKETIVQLRQEIMSSTWYINGIFKLNSYINSLFYDLAKICQMASLFNQIEKAKSPSANNNMLYFLPTELKKIEHISKKILIMNTKTTINFSELLKEIISFTRYCAERKNIKVLLTCKVGRLQVGFDQQVLFQIIYSILSNVIKSLSQGKTIKIKVNNTNANVVIEIVDNGFGIIHEELENWIERGIEDSHILPLSSVKESMDLHFIDYKFASSQAGSKVLLIIPLPGINKPKPNNILFLKNAKVS